MSNGKVVITGGAQLMISDLADGYYLSVYCCISPFCNIMTESHRHDQNISLWRKDAQRIRLIHHWELERITGIKHHGVSFFQKKDLLTFIQNLLGTYSLTLDDMNAIFGIPEISTIDDYHSIQELAKYSYHSIAHLFSSMILNTDIFYNQRIIAISLDDGSDIVTDPYARQKHMFIGAYSDRGDVSYIPVYSPGLYWSTARGIFNLEEGSLMALAYASKSKSLENFVGLKRKFDVSGNEDRYEVITYVSSIVETIFSYSREDEGIRLNYFDTRFSDEENKISMVMKIIQEYSIKEMEEVLDNIIARFRINPTEVYLSLSGGFALNCPTNTYLMNKYKFKGMISPPCVNDGGQAIGIGLYYFYKKMGYFDFILDTPYYGDQDNDLTSLEEGGEFFGFIEKIQYDLNDIVEDLKEQPIIWFDGRAEIGPRALGHRSILADPRTLLTKKMLNDLKQRQWWRPVAPIVLEECLEDWFENAFESPYMLNNFKVVDEKRDCIPAVLHDDGTARVQTLSNQINPALHDVLYKFYMDTNVPVLCNTSLNDKGEPIINSIKQVFNFALRKGIRIIYINGIRVVLKNHDLFRATEPERREDALFIKYRDNIPLKVDINPHSLSIKEYFLYKETPSLSSLNIEKETDVQLIKKINKKVRSIYQKLPSQ